METKEDAWKMLLESLDKSEIQIWDMRKREVELLNKLMDREQNIKSLIHIIAEMTYGNKAESQLSDNYSKKKGSEK